MYMLYILSSMCYEWKFKAMNVCSMKVKSIHEQMWENNNQLSKLLDHLLNFLNLGNFPIVEVLFFLDLEYF